MRPVLHAWFRWRRRRSTPRTCRRCRRNRSRSTCGPPALHRSAARPFAAPSTICAPRAAAMSRCASRSTHAPAACSPRRGFPIPSGRSRSLRCRTRPRATSRACAEAAIPKPHRCRRLTCRSRASPHRLPPAPPVRTAGQEACRAAEGSSGQRTCRQRARGSAASPPAATASATPAASTPAASASAHRPTALPQRARQPLPPQARLPPR